MRVMRTLVICFIFVSLWWKVFALYGTGSQPEPPADTCGACEQWKDSTCQPIGSDTTCQTCNNNRDCKSPCKICHPERGECVTDTECVDCTGSASICGACGVCTLDGRCASLEKDCQECDLSTTCGPCQECSERGKCEHKKGCKRCKKKGNPCPPCHYCNEIAEECQLKTEPVCHDCLEDKPCPPCHECKSGECVAQKAEDCQVCSAPEECNGKCQTCDQKSGSCAADPNCKLCRTVADCDGPCQACYDGECLTLSCNSSGPSKAVWVIFTIGMCVVIVVVGLYVWREVKRNRSPIRSIGNQYDVVNRSA